MELVHWYGIEMFHFELSKNGGIYNFSILITCDNFITIECGTMNSTFKGENQCKYAFLT